MNRDNLRRFAAVLFFSVGRRVSDASPTYDRINEQRISAELCPGGGVVGENGSCDASVDDDGRDAADAVPSNGVVRDGIFEDYETAVPARAEETPCVDEHELCEFWAREGECQNNPNYMLRSCKKSCKTCLAKIDMGEEQAVNDAGTREILAKSEEYMRDVVHTDPKYEKIRDDCKNQHDQCAFWASIGECDANPGYMKLSCAVACRTCEMLDMDLRCPLDPDAVDALLPGDLDRLFERVANSTEGAEHAVYSPTVHSRPGGDGDDPSVLDGPWVVTFEDFLSEEECARLIELGGDKGYQRSTNVGRTFANGTAEAAVSETRTSTNAWCVDECYTDPVAVAVEARMADMLKIPKENQENLQMLKYEVGQFYTSHHDYIPGHVERQPGPRILTFFLYLNDVEAGGGTGFTNLDLTIKPKTGRALLWPSVKNEDPLRRDSRTHHEALPVEAGIKYGANAWIHMREFKEANANNCIG